MRSLSIVLILVVAAPFAVDAQVRPPIRSLRPNVPAEYRPPAGKCRIWIEGVAASRQPAPTDCATALRQNPPNGTVIFGPSAQEDEPAAFERRQAPAPTREPAPPPGSKAPESKAPAKSDPARDTASAPVRRPAPTRTPTPTKVPAPTRRRPEMAPTPDRPTPDGPTPDRPTPDGPTPDGPTLARPTADRPTSSDRQSSPDRLAPERP